MSDQRVVAREVVGIAVADALGGLLGINLLTEVSGTLELLQTRIAQGRIKDVDRYFNATNTSRT